MLGIAEKIDFQTGRMVEVRKNYRSTAFQRVIIWVVGGSGGKNGRKKIQLVTIRRRFWYYFL